MQVETGNNVLISGFIVRGSVPKEVAIRGIGPSLSQLKIPGALVDPTLELRDNSGTLLRRNDDWKDDPAQALRLIEFGLAPQDSKEAAIMDSLPGGAYTAILAGNNNGTGVGLLEIYDVDRPIDSQLANISTRGLVLTGDKVMIGGFILSGSADTHVVVRGLGPSLAQPGLDAVLPDPVLEIRDGNGGALMVNNNWQDDPVSAAQLTALGLAPTDPLESALYLSLSPGAFTAILTGNNGETGIGLLEIYNLH